MYCIVQDSGRSSDSSSLSLSVCGSAKRPEKQAQPQPAAGFGGLSSPVRTTAGSGGRRLDPPLEFGIGSTTSTPLNSRRSNHCGLNGSGVMIVRLLYVQFAGFCFLRFSSKCSLESTLSQNRPTILTQVKSNCDSFQGVKIIVCPTRTSKLILAIVL